MIMNWPEVQRPIVTGRPGTASYPFHYMLAVLILGQLISGSPCGRPKLKGQTWSIWPPRRHRTGSVRRMSMHCKLLQQCRRHGFYVCRVLHSALGDLQPLRVLREVRSGFPDAANSTWSCHTYVEKPQLMPKSMSIRGLGVRG